jgi:hypothetical protein
MGFVNELLEKGLIFFTRKNEKEEKKMESQE